MVVTSTGVYGKTESLFFKQLQEEEITLFIDVRQRRGVRGSKYKFVNSKYLQAKLAELNIKYLYIKELAPTKEIRIEQKKSDLLNQQSKREREYLGSVFKQLYQLDILNYFDFQKLLPFLHKEKTVFFCVEGKHTACHRALILEKLEQEFNIHGYHF